MKFNFKTATTLTNQANKKDEFTPAGISNADVPLEVLNKTNKTIIYFAYQYFSKDNIDKFERALQERFDRVKDSLRIQKGISNLNILVVVNSIYNSDLPANQKTTSYKEKFYPVAGLDKTCTDKVNEYLASSSKKLFTNGMDAALKERADKLKEGLNGCAVVNPFENAPKFDVNTITNIAIKISEKIGSLKGDDAGCNFCVREAISLITGDKVLYPKEGSECFTCDPISYPKGEITNPGKANDIADDLSKLDKFLSVPTISDPYDNTKSIPDFETIQDLANEGKIVVGVRKKEGSSGHVVLVVSGETEEYELNSTKNIYKVPVVLDCGAGAKFSKVKASEKWKNKVLETNWYVYINK